MRESKVEKAFCDGVVALGGTADKTRDLLRRGRPDREVTWPLGTLQAEALTAGYAPVVEFAELKAPDGKLESWQRRYHQRLTTQGFQVHVIWNLEQVDAYLRSRGKK